MSKSGLIAIAIITLLALVFISFSDSQGQRQIRVVGSSTVYPFTAAVAERLGQSGVFKTPIVEATGTGGGIKLFCSGVGPNTPDMVNASRKIKSSELEQCKKNGVTSITEIPIGFDGIVLANSVDAPHFSLTKAQVFLALAKEIPVNGKLEPNRFVNWRQIDSALPDEKIEIYGPPPTSGTRDAFVELLMEKACESFSEFEAAYPEERERKKRCHLIREDGIYIDAGENDNIIVQKLKSNPMALGIFGFGFLEENASAVQGSHINGVQPTFDNILDQKYTVSRSLYIYVKNGHADLIPGIREFVREYTSEAAFGPEGYLALQGLIPMREEEREFIRTNANNLKNIDF